MPAAGKLNKWVDLQRPREESDQRDDVGQPLDPWPSIGEMWAAIEPLSGVETFASNQTRPITAHRVTIRWRPDVLSNMRFVWRDMRTGKTRVFQIDGPPLDPDERGEELVCMCQEREAA